jgi:bifunctional enzyme CysN/CysC
VPDTSDLLRVSTSGSVDDGKSTLIGRLLLDTQSLHEDQLLAAERASRAGGEEELNLALITDGLRAEREQKITIDVAIRMFSSPRRRFILADTPGHEQYTRNMATGASTADLAIILIDARKGVLEQTRRHAFITSLLRVPHVVAAVNKMDLVDWSQDAYEACRASLAEFAVRLRLPDLQFIPISALLGDNVARRSEQMPWHQGPTLLHILESTPSGSRRNGIDFRLPIQCVLRPHQEFRGLAGRVAGGKISAGEEVMALPGGQRSRIAEIAGQETASAGESVVLRLEDEIDASRGSLLVRPGNAPSATRRLQAHIVWMDEEPLVPGRSWKLMHCGRTIDAQAEAIDYAFEVSSASRRPAEALEMNGIGRAVIRLDEPIFADAYAENSETGAFILIEPASNRTAGAGMITRVVAPLTAPAAPGPIWEPWNIPREEREAAQGHPALCVWLTGLSGAGKSTLARRAERSLFERGIKTMLLDGDQVRHGLCKGLGFSAEDRRENIRRVAETARLFFEQGSVVFCAFISPYRADREAARALFPEGRFLEVHVDAPLDALEARDPKGLYARARSGEIRDFTGISSPYEPPERPELIIFTAAADEESSSQALLELIWKTLA